MGSALHKRGLGWGFTLLVLGVVLTTGSRLIYLSAQHRAAVARQTATSVATALVAKIEPRLRQLADRARQAAAGNSAIGSRSESEVPPAFAAATASPPNPTAAVAGGNASLPRSRA